MGVSRQGGIYRQDLCLGYASCWWISCLHNPRPPLLSSKMSYRQISWSLEAGRLDVIIVTSLWNLTGILAALLPRCLSNVEAIGEVWTQILRLRVFMKSCVKMSYSLVNKGPVQDNDEYSTIMAKVQHRWEFELGVWVGVGGWVSLGGWVLWVEVGAWGELRWVDGGEVSWSRWVGGWVSWGGWVNWGGWVRWVSWGRENKSERGREREGEVSSANWWPFCPCLTMLTHCGLVMPKDGICLGQHWLR